MSQKHCRTFSISTQVRSTMNGYTAAVLAPLHSLLWAPQSQAKGVPMSPGLSWYDQDEMPSQSETESDEERLKSDARVDDFEAEEDDVSIASSFLCQQLVYISMIFGIFKTMFCVVKTQHRVWLCHAFLTTKSLFLLVFCTKIFTLAVIIDISLFPLIFCLFNTTLFFPVYS